MEINPYASPCEQSQSDEVPVGEYYVDGGYLVVTDGAELPMRCVATGALVSESDRQTKQFEWAPSFRLVLHRRKCFVSFYVSRTDDFGLGDVAKRFLRRVTVEWMSIVVRQRIVRRVIDVSVLVPV